MEIKKRGRLELAHKTFLNREIKENEIEICLWDIENKHKFTIASFDFDEEYNCFRLNSCLDRLNNKDIDWVAFGELVILGYRHLNREVEE
jgi:hypothetical protein